MADSTPGPSSDVIRSATLNYYYQGKKPKKRFCVLQGGKLEFFESEKKYKQSNRQAKRIFPLDSVLNVNRKTVDSKLSNAIALFTRSDCLVMGLETEEERDIWIEKIKEQIAGIRRASSLSSLEQESGVLAKFEHIWDVNVVKKEGLKSAPNLTGWQRLCLAPVGAFLFRNGAPDPPQSDEDMHTFPWICVRNYGMEKGDKLRVQAGRQAPTGEGEVWMQAEAPIVAQSIHSWMKNILEESRERAPSFTADQRRPQWTSSRQRDRAGSSLQPAARVRALSESEKKLQSIRQRLSEVQTKKIHGTSAETLHSGGSLSARYQQHSPFVWVPPAGQSSLASSSGNQSTESVSGGSAEELGTGMTHIGRHLSRSYGRTSSVELVHPSVESGTPTIAEEGADQADYLVMASSNTAKQGTSDTVADEGEGSGETVVSSGKNVTRAASEVRSRLREFSMDAGDMGAPDYVDMMTSSTSAGRFSTEGGRTQSNATDSKDSAYTEMSSPRGACDTVLSPIERGTDYTPMGKQGPSHSRQTSWNLEEVKSYISDSDRDSCYSSYSGSAVAANQPHTRAYSLGSRPPITCLIDPPETTEIPPGTLYTKMVEAPPHSSGGPSRAVEVSAASLAPEYIGEDRKRAHSVGSKWRPANTFRKISLGHMIQPSDSSDFSRGRSDSFGSGRSTPLSKRLLADFGGRGRSLGAHSEDLVEVDFGPSPPGRSSSGSFGSSESLSRSRASSFGHQVWSPKIEGIAEDKSASPQPVNVGPELALKGSSSVPGMMRQLMDTEQTPSEKLIAQYIKDHEETFRNVSGLGNPMEHDKPLNRSVHSIEEEDYDMMTPKVSTSDTSPIAGIVINRDFKVEDIDYAAMRPGSETPKISVHESGFQASATLEPVLEKAGHSLLSSQPDKTEGKSTDYINYDFVGTSETVTEPLQDSTTNPLFPLTISITNEREDSCEIAERLLTESPSPLPKKMSRERLPSPLGDSMAMWKSPTNQRKSSKSPKEKMSPISKLWAKNPFNKFITGKEGPTSPQKQAAAITQHRSSSSSTESPAARKSPFQPSRGGCSASTSPRSPDPMRKRHSSSGHKSRTTSSSSGTGALLVGQREAPGSVEGGSGGLLLPVTVEGLPTARRSFTELSALISESKQRKFSPSQQFVAESLGAAKCQDDLVYATLNLQEPQAGSVDQKTRSGSGNSDENQPSRKPSNEADVEYAQIDTGKSMGTKLARN